MNDLTLAVFEPGLSADYWLRLTAFKMMSSAHVPHSQLKDD